MCCYQSSLSDEEKRTLMESFDFWVAWRSVTLDSAIFVVVILLQKHVANYITAGISMLLLLLSAKTAFTGCFRKSKSKSSENAYQE